MKTFEILWEQSHVVSNCCWKNGINRLAWHTAAPDRPLVKNAVSTERSKQTTIKCGGGTKTMAGQRKYQQKSRELRVSPQKKIQIRTQGQVWQTQQFLPMKQEGRHSKRDISRKEGISIFTPSKRQGRLCEKRGRMCLGANRKHSGQVCRIHV